MKANRTEIEGLLIIEPDIYYDKRGYFFESYNEKKYRELGIEEKFVQDNQSQSSRGVVRGMHFQVGEMAQAKLVRVAQGRVVDIVVDLRKDSPSFGKHFAIELTGENGLQLFVPRGFAHGFVTLSEKSIFCYKCDNYYDKASEGGIIYNDATLNLDWHLPEEALIVSEKDRQLPTFEEAMR